MKLSTQQLARLSGLLEQVVDADAAAREQWLLALPAEQRDLEPALRRALLRQGQPAFDASLAALPSIGATGQGQAASGLRSGDAVGPYGLLRPLGTGGMAEVWLAQRADGAFKREVALKTPSQAQWRQDLSARFEVERDILAALEHAHIARFYDAGVSADGRPYLALEYVAGKGLLPWANERRLGIHARIELFLQVLQAVQYAHDKGVLHRDIKPGNVLVNDAGQVKLLDFGVARLMERPAEADLTQIYGRALTPGYASPEQLKGERVDAASDVYALGVVLYELLSGHRPHGSAGRAEVPEHAAQPPSARLDAPAAELRGGGVDRIRRDIQGDLDAITLKALAHEASDRYDSAQALARDLRRHLSGEPVQAVPDSVRYRAGKFLMRHRVAVAQVAAMAVVIVGVGFVLMRLQPAATPPTPQAAVAPPATPAMPVQPSPRGIKGPNPEAYNLVLQGDLYVNGPFERDAQRAEVSFKKAIALDPDYALPWVKLALLSMRQADLSSNANNEANTRAREAIEAALRIDPDSMAAHAARFRYLVRVEFRWADARAELDRMRAIQANDALLLPQCEATFAAITGHLDEAIHIQGQIVGRDPLNAAAIGTLAAYLLESDRFRESAVLFQRQLQLNPHAIGSHGLIGVNLALLGAGEDALVEIAKERHSRYRQWALAVTHWTLGHQEASDVALSELKKMSPHTNAYWIARVYAAQGKKNQTFEWLNKACSERQSGCDLLKSDRFLRNLRDDPRYRALLRKLKLDGDPPLATR